MSAPAEVKVDRSRWGSGPWDGEPDRGEFRAHGFPALMVRARAGHWCGYVGVPKGHPWHGEGNYFWDRKDGPDVHGGVTYGDACAGHICHVPAPGEPDDVWWIGFDCAHSGDLSPMDGDRIGFFGGESYRTERYVRAEVERLARQAAEAPYPCVACNEEPQALPEDRCAQCIAYGMPTPEMREAERARERGDHEREMREGR